MLVDCFTIYLIIGLKLGTRLQAQATQWAGPTRAHPTPLDASGQGGARGAAGLAMGWPNAGDQV